MNVLPDHYINAELELNVSIVSQDMLVNVPQDTKETEDTVANRVKSKLDAIQISIVLTTPNVPKDPVPVDQGSKLPEPFVLTLMNVRSKKIFVDQVQHVPTK